MEANEFFLNEHLKKEAESDRGQDWKDDYIAELLAEGGEFYPFSVDNFCEAIAELDLGQQILVSSYAHCAAKFHFEVSNRNFSEYMQTIAIDYWKKAAEKKSDADYDTYYQDKRSCQG